MQFHSATIVVNSRSKIKKGCILGNGAVRDPNCAEVITNSTAVIVRHRSIDDFEYTRLVKAVSNYAVPNTTPNTVERDRAIS